MIYTAPTVATSVPKAESWTEIRCPACIPLGWSASKLLFKVSGVMSASGAVLQLRCHRCRSLIAWEIGTPRLQAVEKGPKNDKRQKVSFE